MSLRVLQQQCTNKSEPSLVRRLRLCQGSDGSLGYPCDRDKLTLRRRLSVDKGSWIRPLRSDAQPLAGAYILKFTPPHSPSLSFSQQGLVYYSTCIYTTWLDR